MDRRGFVWLKKMFLVEKVKRLDFFGKKIAEIYMNKNEIRTEDSLKNNL